MQISTSDEMHMEVEDGLTRAWTYIEHRAITIFNAALASDLRSDQVATAYGLGIFGCGFLQAPNVFFGNDENVRGGLRINVFEGKGVGVFINLFGRHFATDDAAEKTIFH